MTSIPIGNLERAIAKLRRPLFTLIALAPNPTLAELTKPRWLSLLQPGALGGPAAQRLAERLAALPPAPEYEFEIAASAGDRAAEAVAGAGV